MPIKELENARAEYAVKYFIDGLEKYVKTCDPNAITYAIDGTMSVVGLLKQDKDDTGDKMKKALEKIELLGKEFANKCSCTKK